MTTRLQQRRDAVIEARDNLQSAWGEVAEAFERATGLDDVIIAVEDAATTISAINDHELGFDALRASVKAMFAVEHAAIMVVAVFARPARPQGWDHEQTLAAIGRVIEYVARFGALVEAIRMESLDEERTR